MRSQIALVLGGASCVWDDVYALEEMYGRRWDGLVVAANDVGAHWPRELHHWATLHALKLPVWQVLRHRLTLYKNFSQPQTWAPRPRYDADVRHAQHTLKPWADGSSGMYALQVALHVGARRVVLCGVPMTQTAHFAQSQETFAEHWQPANVHLRHWRKNANLFQAYTRSMSGATRDLLGVPTLDWLNEAAEGVLGHVTGQNVLDQAHRT